MGMHGTRVDRRGSGGEGGFPVHPHTEALMDMMFGDDKEIQRLIG